MEPDYDEDDIFTAAEMEAFSPAERREIVDEMQLLEELGMGADGSAMHLGDDDWFGQPWEPERNVADDA